MILQDSMQRQGRARDVEDGLILCPPHTFGVTDGCSFYHPENGPPRIDGMTQGMLATRHTQQEFLRSSPDETAEEVLIRANRSILERALAAGLSLSEPEHLPGAAFAIAKECGDQIDVLHASDAGAVWLNHDGTFGGTPNQALAYEAEVSARYAAFMQQFSGDRNQAWTAWLPQRATMIRTYQNSRGDKGWGALTGQPEFEEGLWGKIVLQRKNLALLLLFTDGCVSQEETADPNSLAQKLIELYTQGGLGAIYNDAMEAAKRRRGTSHVDAPEATAVALRFA